MNEITGNLQARGLKIGLVVSRFNERVTDRLLSGAREWLLRAGALDEDLTVVRVPGSFEIPIAAQMLAASGKYEAIVCLGALIRGETDHYEVLAAEVSRGLGEVSRRHGVPVAFGVITASTVEQALNRSGVKHGNKGAEAAMAAVEMARVARKLKAD